jgi:hypothetical protein
MAWSPDGRDIDPWTPAALKQDACSAEVVDKLPPQPPSVTRQPLPVTLSHRSAPALHDDKGWATENAECGQRVAAFEAGDKTALSQ